MHVACSHQVATSNCCRSGGSRPQHALQRQLVPTQQCRVLGAQRDLMQHAPLIIRTQCDAAAAEAPTEAPGPSGFSSLEGCDSATLRVLWDSVAKPLLKIGRSGATDPQARSLSQLVSSHSLVKVQVNGDPGLVNLAAARLTESSGCALLQAKGNTLLFAPAHADTGGLLQAAQATTAITSARRERKVTNRQDPRQGLAPQVAAGLQSLFERGVFQSGDLDRRAIRALAGMPADDAAALLLGVNKTTLRGVKNRSAWLTSKCRGGAGGSADAAGADDTSHRDGGSN